MNKHSKTCTVIGLLLLAVAFCLTAYNFLSDKKAGDSASMVLEQMSPMPEEDREKIPETFGPDTSTPDYLLNPNMDMPEEEIDGQRYIGVLRIPSLSLELPVISKWSYQGLQIAPCRYDGSAYQNNLVIAAHNYASHFGNLGQLSQGDEITFTDMDGNIFFYEVASLETLSPYAVEDMTEGGWALTLFTCTVGGQARVAVRCSAG